MNDPALRIVHDIPAELVADSLWRAALRIESREALPPGSAVGLARRWPSDWGRPQFAEPGAENFVRVSVDTAAVAPRFGRVPELHPFDHVLVVELPEGLAADAPLRIEFGLGAGMRAQTFVEKASPLRVLVKPAGQPRWRTAQDICTRIIGGEPAELFAVAPSVVAIGEAFAIHVSARDRWGNPATGAELNLGCDGMQQATAILSCRGPASVSVEAVLNQPGVHRVVLRDAGGRFRAETNPIRCEAAPQQRIYWGDIHAQSAIGCGAQTIEDYFLFARDVAGVDFASHQANCFLVSNPEWAETEAVTARLNEPGRFVTFLGVEWSGATPVGGDHNLYFPGDAAELRRCSHQHLDDRSDEASDLPHVSDLHAQYRGRDVLGALHVGGRTTNLAWHEPGFERLLEVHSTHATSDWFLFEALERGYRLGVTGGSDGVDGRPGASHPGRMTVRNLKGGLTALAAPRLDRATLWQALCERRSYGTSGPRMLLDIRAGQLRPGDEGAAAGGPTLDVSVNGTAPLRAIELFRGATPIARAEPRPGDAAGSDTIRVSWTGAAAPGNWERARLRWDGAVVIANGDILEARGWALDTPAEGIVRQDAGSVAFSSITAGDWDGLELRLAEIADTTLTFSADGVSVVLPLSLLRAEPFDPAPTGNRRVRIERLPKQAAPRDWTGALSDPSPPRGTHAYWIRVAQDDGAFAWSTPIWLAVKP